MSNVLFVCIQNAGRSQIAQALFRARRRRPARGALGRQQPGRSASTRRWSRPCASSASTSPPPPHRLDPADMQWADLVVTMGCGDDCPYIPGKRYVDWELDDPAGQPIEDVRRIRDQIASRVDSLLAELGTPEEVTS